MKYDFNRATELQGDMKDAFDRILCDPPYHSKACVSQCMKTQSALTNPVLNVVLDAKTVDWLAKDGIEGLKIVCTGETIQEVVLDMFDGTSMMPFRPQHTVRLDNTYACFADSWQESA